MAKISMMGSGDPAVVADFLAEQIQGSALSCELVESVQHNFASGQVIIMVFEKYYWRASNRASLTVAVYGENGRVIVDAIGSGGGQGPIFRMSWGSEENFVATVSDILEARGFGLCN